jgi:hypothetical protein
LGGNGLWNRRTPAACAAVRNLATISIMVERRIKKKQRLKGSLASKMLIIYQS